MLAEDHRASKMVEFVDPEMLSSAKAVAADVRQTGLEPQTSRPQTSRPQRADPRPANPEIADGVPDKSCYSHA